MSRTTITVTADKSASVAQALIDNAGKIYKNAISSVKPKLIRQAELIVTTAIDSYYDSYSPYVYNRSESLYSVFRVEDTAFGFDLLFDEKNLDGKHREGATGKYIYDVMLKKGYHGGAPHNGNYYWRFPSPQFASDMGVPPYITWYPFGPAVQTESPWERIQAEWAIYSNTEGKQLLLKAFQSEIDKVIKEVS